MVLNTAFKRVFFEIALVERKDFRLHAQIHDSILFSYRKGRQDLAYKVRDCLQVPVLITDPFGVSRTLCVPAALKGEGRTWATLKDMR